MTKKLTPKVFLRDLNTDLIIFWKQYFHAFPDVEVSHGDIFEIKADGIVSPANSFGAMGGGIDLLYRDKFGLDVEKLVQQNIKMHYYDELPVGQALSVPMRKQAYQYLIVAPTMRLPMNIDNTLNPYFSFRAALISAKDKQMESILCPGLGTLTGGACPEMVARQMFVAYLNVVREISPTNIEHTFKQMNWMLRCSRDKKPEGV
ncbi:MAG: macro domain-containing protein [bacterium]